MSTDPALFKFLRYEAEPNVRDAMLRLSSRRLGLLGILFLLLGYSANVVTMAQTPAFTYQGRLSDQSVPASGVYDFEFRLYDESSAQIGPTLTREDLPVTNGIFTVNLDFGATAFNGQIRLLEIAVRPGTSAGSFNTLSPRQPITSSPYAIRTLSAAQAETATDAQKLGGVTASEYVKTDDPRLIPGPPIAGSPNYIQNGTNPQTAANFNISGDGRVGGILLVSGNETVGGTVSAQTINTATQYNINGNRVMALASGSTFVGLKAGESTTGIYNSFFGEHAGSKNTSGQLNSFFGTQAGRDNTEGDANSFFGLGTGSANTTGFNNSFFGYGAGANNKTGAYNTSFGAGAGTNLFSGNNNTFIGAEANGSHPDLENATAIGALAVVETSNSLVLGNGVNVGIGTSSPTERLTIKTATSQYGMVHTDGNITMGTFVGGNGQGGYIGTRSNHPLHFFVNDGPASMTLDTSGKLRLNNLSAAGLVNLCINSSNQVGFCSSSLRYKTNVAPLTSGLSLIKLLQPITFDWKANGEHDLGLGAEDVARVAPLLVVHNDKGEVEGVKYDRIAVVLVNAVREQQQQIEQLQKDILALKRQDFRRQDGTVLPCGMP